MLGLLVVAFFFVVLCVLLISAGVQAIADTDAFRVAGDVVGYATTHLWTIAIWVPILAIAAAMKVLGYERVFTRIFTGIFRAARRILRAVFQTPKPRDRVDQDTAAAPRG